MPKQKGWGRTILDAVLTPEQLEAGFYLEEQEDELILSHQGKRVATWTYPWTRPEQPAYASIPEIQRRVNAILRERKQPEEQAGD